MEKDKFTVGVFGILFDERERVLLCHRRDYNFWNLPGGALERGETPWEGAMREVKEETGLDVEVVRLLGVYSKPDVDDVVLTFLCRAIGGAITLNDEADAIQYFAFTDIPHNTAPKQVLRIKDAMAHPEATLLRAQPGASAIELFSRK
jgi:ADP-ribose pyrophosphatase YjhB (NUDIX family)